VHHSIDASPWVQRWSHLVAPGARVLDVACGSGRHLRWFAQRGCTVVGVDRDAAALAAAREADAALRGAELIEADIENGPWPLAQRRFDAVVVTNYLWRALLPAIVDAVDAGGVLIYETFALGNERYGKPANPAFLLRPGELLAAAQGLRVIAYEDGFVAQPDRCVQRVVAVREKPANDIPVLYRL
jgi:SAM-dependent methyltransferase